MLRNNMIIAVVLGSSLTSLPAFSQENPVFKADASVQVSATFVKNTVDGNGVSQNATTNGGILADYRFFFKGNNGLELNYGYGFNTQRYGLATGLEGIKARSDEASAAY